MWVQVEGTMAWEVRRGLEGMHAMLQKGQPCRISCQSKI